jgi:hypothetical protein
MHRIIRYIIFPWAILRKIRSFEDLRYILKLAGIALAMLWRRSKTSKDLIYGKEG